MDTPDTFDPLHVTDPLHERRERVFIVLAGIFLGAMTMLNILGITKFVHLGPLALAVGVLPYPLTFLCTDFISEFYGRRRANFVVWVGLLLNGFVLLFLYLGDSLPAVDSSKQPPWQMLHLSQPVLLNTGVEKAGQVELFHILYTCTRGAVLASMCAYVAAQFCDVFMFHFWKKLTKGKHLWLRNNGSTMISQLVDSTAVIFITFWASLSRGEMTMGALWALVGSSYLFKLVVAAVDTIPFYIGVKYLTGYLKIDPTQEHGTGTVYQVRNMEFNTDNIDAALNSAYLMPIDFVARRNGLASIHVEPWGLDFELRHGATSQVLLYSEGRGVVQIAFRNRDLLIDTDGVDLIYSVRHVDELSTNLESMNCEFAVANECETPIEVETPSRRITLQSGAQISCRVSGPRRWVQIVDASPSTIRIGFPPENSGAQTDAYGFEVL